MADLAAVVDVKIDHNRPFRLDWQSEGLQHAVALERLVEVGTLAVDVLLTQKVDAVTHRLDLGFGLGFSRVRVRVLSLG